MSRTWYATNRGQLTIDIFQKDSISILVLQNQSDNLVNVSVATVPTYSKLGCLISFPLTLLLSPC